MIDLSFEVVGARVERHAAVPTVVLRLRVTEAEEQRVHALALLSQIRIEPNKRHYGAQEESRLYELFGETPQWGDSLRPFVWTHVATTVGGFDGIAEFDLPVECTYDFEVAAAKYMHALGGGEIPLIILFSGTVFSAASANFAAERVSWGAEAAYRLPVSLWRSMMDLYFPNSGWLRVHRDTLDRLQRFRAERAAPTWDLAFEQLLKEAGVEEP